ACCCICSLFFFFQAEDGIRDFHVTGVQTCALPISLDPLLTLVGGDHHRVGPVEAAVAVDDRDAALLEQPLEAAYQTFDGLALALERRLPVEIGGAGHHSEVGGVPDCRVHLRHPAPLLGGATAPGQTGAAGPFVHHQGHVEAEVVGVER